MRKKSILLEKISNNEKYMKIFDNYKDKNINSIQKLYLLLLMQNNEILLFNIF